MKDIVVFLKNVVLDGETVFKKDSEYEILGENHLNYFVQIKKNTNEVCEISKTEENKLFYVKGA